MCQLGQRDVVAVGDVGVIVVKLLVFVQDTGLCQCASQQARTELQLILVAAATIQVEQLEGAQGLLNTRVLYHAYGIVGLPALPHVREPFAGLQVEGEAKGERRQLRIGRVAGRHGEDIQRGHILFSLLDACLESVIPGLQSPCAADDVAKGREIAGIAQLEEQVAAVAGHGAPDVRMQHAPAQRAVSATGFAKDSTPAPSQGAIGAVNVGHQFLDEVVVIVADRGRIEILAASIGREAFRHDDNEACPGP